MHPSTEGVKFKRISHTNMNPVLYTSLPIVSLLSQIGNIQQNLQALLFPPKPFPDMLTFFSHSWTSLPFSLSHPLNFNLLPRHVSSVVIERVLPFNFPRFSLIKSHSVSHKPSERERNLSLCLAFLNTSTVTPLFKVLFIFTRVFFKVFL